MLTNKKTTIQDFICVYYTLVILAIFFFFMAMWTMHVLQRSHAKSSNLFRASFACCFFRAFAIWLLFTNAILSLTAPAALVECYIHPDLQEALLKHTHPPLVSLKHTKYAQNKNAKTHTHTRLDKYKLMR